MEFIIGAVLLLIAVGIVFYCCKNLTINVTINYPEPKYVEVNDLFDENGEDKEVDKDKYDFDNMLKEINDLMLGEEESNG